ncbi:MAG: PEP-CTERM sorting domain-containing protein, partial [Duganella sp.]
GARFTSGAGGTALARASSAYHAQATASAESGTGRAGGRDAPSATAEAVVNRVSGTLLPPAPTLPAEARAFAVAGAFGGQALARSTYRDSIRGAAVIATASGQPSQLYSPEASSAANVGGAAYAPWTPEGGAPRVTAYASALPDTASLAPLLASSPTVEAAMAGAEVLGAGTVGALFFPFTASASFEVPFTSGRHLLLGFVQPFTTDFPGATFEFSVQQGGTTLYTGSFSDPAQYNSFFNDKVLDLGVITSNSLDLLLTFSLSQGIYGFSYLLAAGDAVSAVPEPSTWLMLVLGLALLIWRGIGQSTGFAPVVKLNRHMCNSAQQLH